MKVWKITIQKLALVVCLLVVLIAAVHLLKEKPKEKVSAEVFISETMFCDEPLSTMTFIDDIVDILDGLFQIYKNANLRLAVEHLTTIDALLSSNPYVCDFTKCQAQVADLGGEAALEFDAFFWSGELAMGPIPPGWCDVKECTGQPCPDLGPYIEDETQQKEGEASKFTLGLRSIKESFSASSGMVKEYLTALTAIVSPEIAMELPDGSSDVGKQISRMEEARRKIIATEKWLSPSTGVSCALSERERELVEQGRLGDRRPERCFRALEEKKYWPKPWAEECIGQCAVGLSEECKDCLGSPTSGETVLAIINRKIFGDCRDSCPNLERDGVGFDALCRDCVCEGLSNEGCAAFLCGGSDHNWVCCHEGTLERQF